MALTLTVAQLSEAVRLTVSGSPDAPYLAIVTRQLATATEIIEGYAVDAPDDVQERIGHPACGLLARQAADAQRTFSLSGAQGLLSRWHLPTIAKVE